MNPTGRPWYKGLMPVPDTSPHLRRALLAATIVAASLMLSLGLAKTTHPAGTFIKYPDAVAHWNPSRAQDYSPLYLALARLVIPSLGIAGLRFLQAALLAVACAAAAWAVALEAGVLAGLLAGLLLASYRPLLVYAGVLEPEIMIFTLLAFALLAARQSRRAPAAGWQGPAWAATTGLCLALASMARPQYAVLIPLWAFWMIRLASSSNRWRHATVSLAAASLLLVPFAAHRLVRYGSLSVMNPGPVFYEGNGPQSPTGTYTPPHIVARLVPLLHVGGDPAHVAYRRVVSAEAGHPVGPAGTNRYWARLALEGLRSRPALAARRFASKALLALAPYELHDLVNAHDLDRKLRRYLPWGFGLVLILGIAAVPALWRRLGPHLPALSIAGLSWLVQIVFYPSARQRLPMVLGLGVAAAAALGRRRTGRRSLTLAGVAGVSVVVAVTFLAAPVACFEDATASTLLGIPAPSYGERAAELLEGRTWRPSLRRTVDAVVLAEDAFDQGHPVAAASPLAADLRRASGPAWLRARAAWLSARSLDASGRYTEALEQARRAVVLDAQLLPSRALLAVLEKPDCPEGLEARVLVPGEDPLDAQLLLAEAAAPVRGPACARRVGRTVLAVLPELAGPHWAIPPASAHDDSQESGGPGPRPEPTRPIR